MPALAGAPLGSEGLEMLRACLEDWSLKQEQLLSAALAEVVACAQSTQSNAFGVAPAADSAATNGDRGSRPDCGIAADTVRFSLEDHSQANLASVATADTADGTAGSGTGESSAQEDQPAEPSRESRRDRNSKSSWRRSVSGAGEPITLQQASTLDPEELNELLWHEETGCLHLCGEEAKIHNPTFVQRKLQWVVESKSFEIVCALVILFNATQMAVSVDHTVSELLAGRVPGAIWFDKLEVVFCLFYTVEMLLRLGLYRLRFFLCKDWGWNTLDLFLVGIALQDNMSSGGDDAGNLSFLRIVRILKVLKALRVVRLMRMFRELRLMMSSIFGCMKSLSWALLLIILITYIFGSCFIQAAIVFLQEYPVGERPKETLAGIEMYWSSVPASMNSLFVASTGGESWSYIAKPLQEISLMFYSLFLFYISLILCVVFNTLTSVFMEAMFDNAQADDQTIMEAERVRTQDNIRACLRIFQTIDTDGSGDISLDEMRLHMNESQFLAFMTRLGIDACDITALFDSLSAGGHSAKVDASTFVFGCMKLKGMARSLDLFALTSAHKKMGQQQSQFQNECCVALSNLGEQVNGMRRQMVHMRPLVASPSCQPDDSGRGDCDLKLRSPGVQVEPLRMQL